MNIEHPDTDIHACAHKNHLCMHLRFIACMFINRDANEKFLVLHYYFCQTVGLVFRLRVDFVLPLSQEQQQEEQEEEQPSPKSIRRGCTRRLKFDTYTTHGLLAEFRGLGVRLTQVTQVTRRTPPKSTKTEPNKIYL